MVSSALSPPWPSATASTEPGSDYFTTEAHYLSLAGRVAAAVRSRSFVLVTGDPAPRLRLICEALRRVSESRHRVVEIPCSAELINHDPFLANFAVATPVSGEGAASDGHASHPNPPLFVFEEVDRLSVHQIEQIAEAVARSAGGTGAGVLLARTSFLSRLGEPPLQAFQGALSGRFRAEEIGEDEGIGFLRHQLETRHRDNNARDVRPVLIRASRVFAGVAAVGIGIFLTVHFVRMTGEFSAGSTAGAYPTSRSAPTEPPTVAPPPPVTPAAVTPATPQELEQKPTAPAARPVPQPADLRPLTPELEALMARGDHFLNAGDIASARLFYERAAEAGAGAAALRLGTTYDPEFLGRAGVRGTPGDPAQAASWYRRARELGEAAATERLKTLEAAGRRPGPDGSAPQSTMR